MGITVVAATAERFDDLAAMLGPKRPDATVCWCLSHRFDSRRNREPVGPARAVYVQSLCAAEDGPGVLAYDDGEVVGWAAVAPAELPFARSRKIPHVDDLPVWSIWWLRVRPGHRKRGPSLPLLEGAVADARDRGAPAVEGYPVDNAGARVDTMVAGGFPRVLMRRHLSAGGNAQDGG